MARTQAQLDASARFYEKTYQNVNFQLNTERDADIIESIKEAKELGLTYREWIRELFDSAK